MNVFKSLLLNTLKPKPARAYGLDYKCLFELCYLPFRDSPNYKTCLCK